MHKNEIKTTTKKENERARPARTGPVTLSLTEEQKQKRIAARAAAAMAQVLRRRPRSTVMWGRKKAVIKTYPDGGQEIIVPQTLTAEQQQYEFPPRSRFLKKLATDEKTDLRRFSNPQPFAAPDQLALNEWFSNTLGRKTERISYKRKKSSCNENPLQMKSDAGKKWAHTLTTLEPPDEDCCKYYIPKKLLKCSSPPPPNTRSSLRHSGTESVTSDISTIWKEYQKQTSSSRSSYLNTSSATNGSRKLNDDNDKTATRYKNISNSNSITNSRRSISNSRVNSISSSNNSNTIINRNRAISSGSRNNDRVLINQSISRDRIISTSQSMMQRRTINSPSITSRNRSRTISSSPTKDEVTPITGMVQLIGLLHHSLKEQQQRSIDRMEKLESLLLEERQQREQAEFRKDQTMKKFEHMYQQLQDHIQNTKEDLSKSNPPPPSYQSLLMEKVSTSLSGLERSMHQLQKKHSFRSPPVSISNQRRMTALHQ